MGEIANPTTVVTADMVLQRALDMLYTHNDPNTGLPKFEAVRAGGVLTQLAKEMRLGKAKTRIYGGLTVPADFTDEVVGISWHGVVGATGYDIQVRPGRAPQVIPTFDVAPGVEDGEEVSSDHG